VLRPQAGHIRKVYNAANAQLVTKMDDLCDGLNVVGVGFENFRRGPYNLIKLEQEKKPEEVRRFFL
jgi:hypothetical protein